MAHLRLLLREGLEQLDGLLLCQTARALAFRAGEPYEAQNPGISCFLTDLADLADLAGGLPKANSGQLSRFSDTLPMRCSPQILAGTTPFASVQNQLMSFQSEIACYLRARITDLSMSHIMTPLQEKNAEGRHALSLLTMLVLSQTLTK